MDYFLKDLAQYPISDLYCLTKYYKVDTLHQLYNTMYKTGNMPTNKECLHSIQNKRDYMEDRSIKYQTTINSKQVFIYGVFDGHGGALISQLLHRIIPEEVVKILKQGFNNIKNNIEDLFINVDQCLYDQLDDKAKTSGGSTGIVAIYIPSLKQLVIANLGDSRAIVWKNKKTII